MIEEPFKISDDTYVFPEFGFAPGFGFLPINSYLIKAQEPVLVDTGTSVDREAFLAALKTVIDPADIRWVFLTHDDHDHFGAVPEVLDLAPNARLALSWPSMGKLTAVWQVPVPRVRFITFGEKLNVGDRDLVIVPPIVFDSPGTASLYDTKSQIYFSVDAFGAFVPEAATRLIDLPQDKVSEGFNIFNRANHPWTEFVDQGKFEQRIKTVQALKPGLMLSSHLPPIHQDKIDPMFKSIAAIPTIDSVAWPDQAFLDKMIEQMAAAGGPPGH